MNATRAVSLPSTAAPGSLPPSRGRLLAVYRITWWVLAAAALAVLARLLIEPAMQPAILLLRLVKAAVLVAVAVILFRRRRTDVVAAMLSLAFLLWTITSSFDFSATATWPAALDRLRFVLFVVALLLFPTGEWRPRWTRQVALASVAVFAIGIGEAKGLLGTRLFLPMAIACVLAALAALLTRYRALGEYAERQQLKWVALGLIVGVSLILSARAGAAITSRMEMPLVGNLLLEGIFQLGIVVIAVGFLTSLLRYRLYDAEAAISRSAVYAALTLALVAAFAASEALIELLGQRFFGAAVGNLSGAMAAAVAAILLTPLHGRISGWAEQRFQRDLVLLKQQMPELLADLSGSSSTREVAKAVLPLIDEAVHATRAALVVDGRLIAAHGMALPTAEQWVRHWQPSELAQPLSRDDCDPVFPLRMALLCPFADVRGWLLLGPRPDGSFYGKDELEALTAIAAPLRRALVASRLKQLERVRAAQWQAAFGNHLKRLSQRIDTLKPL